MPKHKSRRKRFQGAPKKVRQELAGVAISPATGAETTPPATPMPRPMAAPVSPKVPTAPTLKMQRPMINLSAELVRISIVTAIVLALLVISVLIFR